MVATNSFKNLSNDDLQHVMLICERLHQADPGQSFLHHCQVVMDQAFACVHHSTELYSLNPFVLTELENFTVDASWIEIFNQHVLDHPYAEHMLSNQHSHLETIQQEPTLKSFKTTALYNEFYNQVQGQNQLWFGYRDNNEFMNVIYLRESEYTDTELSMARLIQPHVETAWNNWKRVRAFKQELDLLKGSIFQSEEQETAAAAIRNRIESLTARQQDVVELVAAGKDNQRIADELHISVGTVKKHLQMIFKALDVQHRTQLAAKWHQGHSTSLC